MLLMTLLSFDSFAIQYCTSNSCLGYAKDVIGNYQVTDAYGGGVYISLANTPEKQNLACQPQLGQYVKLETAHPMFDQMYSELKSSIALNQFIGFSIDLEKNDCTLKAISIFPSS